MRLTTVLVATTWGQFAIAADPTLWHYHEITVNNVGFRAVEIDPKKTTLHWKDRNDQPYRSFGRLKSALKHTGKNVRIMMNAGIYSADDSPAGLHIENNTTLKTLNTRAGKGNFHLQPNGVFFITTQGKAGILTTQAYRKRYEGSAKSPAIRLATQSGPMLLIDGKINAKFIPDSASVYTRNGICTTQNGETFFLSTDNQRSNLYTFATAAKQLHCHNALYLDGSISKLYMSGKNSTFHFGHYVGILAVTE